MSQYLGGCLCGAVRYRSKADPLWAMHCHCSMCRRQSGGSLYTLVGFDSSTFEWVKGQPSVYRSSDTAERGFCERCGSSLTWRRRDEQFSFEVFSVALGSLDKPEFIRPQSHNWTTTMLPWLKLNDDLKHFQGINTDWSPDDPPPLQSI